MSLRNPLARAKGLGSAKDGTSHWWHQRLTAIALALLTPWFVVFAVGRSRLQCRGSAALSPGSGVRPSCACMWRPV